MATAVLDSDPNNRPICSGAYSSAFATLGGMGCALVVLEREQKQYPHHQLETSLQLHHLSQPGCQAHHGLSSRGECKNCRLLRGGDRKLRRHKQTKEE